MIPNSTAGCFLQRLYDAIKHGDEEHQAWLLAKIESLVPELDALLTTKHDSFTETDIRLAFWNHFHESGELWFSYIDDEEGRQSCTKSEWEGFKNSLLEIKKSNQ